MARRIAFNIFAWSIVLMVAFPLFWMVVTSVKPQPELFRRPPTFLPEVWTFEHYAKLLFDTKFMTYFRNSVILSVSTTARGGIRLGVVCGVYELRDGALTRPPADARRAISNCVVAKAWKKNLASVPVCVALVLARVS